MEFTQNGYLTPYESISTDLTTIERVFVTEFGESTTRQSLFESYQQFNDLLYELMPNGFRQWIDGSFVSRKLNPRDINFLTFVDYQLYEQYEQAFDELRRYRLDRKRGIDGYFIKTYPNDHSLYDNYQSDLIEWRYKFSTTRNYKPKGFLDLTV